MYGPVKDSTVEEWTLKMIIKLETLYNDAGISKVIRGRKNMTGWSCLKEPEYYVLCSDRTESSREKNFEETKDALERFYKKGCRTAGR